jgi:hypothetical protein
MFAMLLALFFFVDALALAFLLGTMSATKLRPKPVYRFIPRPLYDDPGHPQPLETIFQDTAGVALAPANDPIVSPIISGASQP